MGAPAMGGLTHGCAPAMGGLTHAPAMGRGGLIGTCDGCTCDGWTGIFLAAPTIRVLDPPTQGGVIVLRICTRIDASANKLK